MPIWQIRPRDITRWILGVHRVVGRSAIPPYITICKPLRKLHDYENNTYFVFTFAFDCLCASSRGDTHKHASHFAHLDSATRIYIYSIASQRNPANLRRSGSLSG